MQEITPPTKGQVIFNGILLVVISVIMIGLLKAFPGI